MTGMAMLAFVLVFVWLALLTGYVAWGQRRAATMAPVPIESDLNALARQILVERIAGASKAGVPIEDVLQRRVEPSTPVESAGLRRLRAVVSRKQEGSS